MEYELTGLGRTLREPLSALTDWAEMHIDDVLAAREDYDSGSAARGHGRT